MIGSVPSATHSHVAALGPVVVTRTQVNPDPASECMSAIVMVRMAVLLCLTRRNAVVLPTATAVVG